MKRLFFALLSVFLISACFPPKDPPPLPPPPPPPVFECNDGLDNDGDELVDFPEDPGCESPEDNDETDVLPPTGDGILTFTDLDYLPAGQQAWLRVFGLDIPENPVVRISGIEVEVLRRVPLDGTQNTFLLNEHAGLVQAGLTPTFIGEFYVMAEIVVPALAAGNHLITIDGVLGELSVTAGALGRVLHAAPGGDNENDGTPESPWAGWGPEIQPGDVLYFQSGAYPSVIANNQAQGATGAPAAAVAFPGAVPTTTGDLGVTQSSGNVTFAGWVRTGGGVGVHATGGINDGVRYVYNDVSGGANVSGFNCMDVKGVTDFEVIGNYFHDAGVNSSQSECVYLQGYTENDGVRILHNKVERFTGKGSYFLFGHVDGESMRNLEISFNQSTDPVGTPSAFAIQLSGTDGATGAWVEDATIIGNTAGPGFTASAVLQQPCLTRGPSEMVTQFSFNVMPETVIATNVAPGSVAEGNDATFVGANCNGETFPVDPNLTITL